MYDSNGSKHMGDRSGNLHRNESINISRFVAINSTCEKQQQNKSTVYTSSSNTLHI